MSYTIHIDKNGAETLKKNGKNVLCPLKGVQPVPVQQLGHSGIAFHEFPCVGHCAHFNDKDDFKSNNGGEVYLSCQSGRSIAIDNVKKDIQ